MYLALCNKMFLCNALLLLYVQVLSVLKLDKRYQVPEGYSESFGKAIAVFHHARMYGLSFMVQFIYDLYLSLHWCIESNDTTKYSENLCEESLIFRYDARTKSLKPLKPLDQKRAQALNGDFDLLGPYPKLENNNLKTSSL